MNVPLQITFRGMDPSEALGERIREAADKLEKFADTILSCRVMVEQPHRHHHRGNHFHVRVQLSIPGREIVVTRDPPRHETAENAYAAVSEAFEAVRRKLQESHRRHAAHG